MMRRAPVLSRTASVVQTACMLLVLLAVGVVFVHSLTHPNTTLASSTAQPWLGP